MTACAECGRETDHNGPTMHIKSGGTKYCSFECAYGETHQYDV